MGAFILGLIIGLIIGWNLLPQPEWVKRIYDRAAAAWRARNVPTTDEED